MRIEETNFTADFNLTTEASKTKISIGVNIGSFEPSTDYDYDITEPSASTTSSQSGTTPTGDYMIADSNTRVISQSEIESFTPWQLKVARNEIYARHGRPFVHKDLQCYFAKQSWYSIDPNYTEAGLSYTENKNIATILAYEQSINSPLFGVDSGCQQ